MERGFLGSHQTNQESWGSSSKKLKRWEARQQLRELLLEADVDTEGNEGPIDSVIITDTHRSLCIHIDLTMLD